MDLRNYLRILRQRWRTVTIVVALVLGLAAVWTVTATPIYASTAKMYVSASQSDTSEAYQGGLLSNQRVTSYAQFAVSLDLAKVVIADLGLDMTPAELASKVSAQPQPETSILTLTLTDADPQQAQALAQAYSEGLADMIRERETPPGQDTSLVNASTIDTADLPSAPVSPNPVRNLGLGLMLGLLLGFGCAVLREMMDTSVKSPEDITKSIDVPLLGAIAFDGTAKSRPLVTDLDSHSPRVESFRVLRTNLQFVDVDTPDKVFIVTSALPEEGKTTTSVNLAITLAQAGARTLLIEGDLRRPRASFLLGLDNSVGVTTVLLGTVTFDDALQKHPLSDLHVLGSGAIPPNPADLLQSKAMAELIQQARSRYDMVIIDAPPLLPVTDGALLAAGSDGAIIVVRHGRTTTDQVSHARDRLDQVDARVVGTVLNMVPTRGNQGGYGYGYGYGYAPTAPPKREKTRRKRRPSQAGE